ncbi:ABC transporter permease [Pseudonocardia sp. H11422]|uniref:ABC transporter permease n=1 Tax=Pseudonocardia sp. H11422 TaxID=2835866 RepID=UPI001BDD5CF9|nr:ABC transporter permease [Pseudonocardia sp. H11422]
MTMHPDTGHAPPRPNDLAIPQDLRASLEREATRKRRTTRIQSPAVMYPLSVLFLVLAWYATIWLTSVDSYLLPTPHAVLAAGASEWELILREGVVTLQEVLAAFALSVVIGFVLGLALALSKVMRNLIEPLLVMSQGVPKIALAPVFLAWFGFGFTTNLLIGVLIAVFPMIINTMLGIAGLDPDLLRMGRALSSSRWRLFWLVRLPAALPSLFAGMKISITFAAIGAIIGEFTAGSAGLGFLIQSTIGNLEMPLGFAAVAATALLGLLTYLGVELAERLFLRTRQSHALTGQ